jgi:hypothetical protein
MRVSHARFPGGRENDTHGTVLDLDYHAEAEVKLGSADPALADDEFLHADRYPRKTGAIIAVARVPRPSA